MSMNGAERQARHRAKRRREIEALRQEVEMLRRRMARQRPTARSAARRKPRSASNDTQAEAH